MKSIKLTPKEKELFELLKQTTGGVLRQHVKPTNTVCFRILDEKKNPLLNVRQSTVYGLLNKNILMRLPEEQFKLMAD